MNPAHDIEEIAEESCAGKIAARGQGRYQRADQKRRENDVGNQCRYDASNAVQQEVFRGEPHAASRHEKPAQGEEHRHQQVFRKPEGGRPRGFDMPAQRGGVPGDNPGCQEYSQEIKALAEALLLVQDGTQGLHLMPSWGPRGPLLWALPYTSCAETRREALTAS